MIAAAIITTILVLLVIGLVAYPAFFRKPGGKDGHKKPDDHSHDKGTSHGQDHSADDAHHGHAKKPWWVTILTAVGVIVIVLVALKFVIVPILASWGFFQRPGLAPSERLARETSVAQRMAPKRFIPSDALPCPDTKIVIEPGKSILVLIPEGMMIDFKPDTQDGTIKACDYHRPDQCSSTTSLLDIETSVLAVENVTLGKANEGRVNFTCHYVPR